MPEIYDCRFTKTELRIIVEALRISASEARKLGIDKDYNSFRDLASQIQANVLEKTV